MPVHDFIAQIQQLHTAECSKHSSHTSIEMTVLFLPDGQAFLSLNATCLQTLYACCASLVLLRHARSSKELWLARVHALSSQLAKH
eukprot:6188525-Pleurochrysis_carterae.AAC.1